MIEQQSNREGKISRSSVSDPGPRKQKVTHKKFHVCKCWVFSLGGEAGNFSSTLKALHGSLAFVIKTFYFFFINRKLF
jgi:hypothetical protein